MGSKNFITSKGGLLPLTFIVSIFLFMACNGKDASDQSTSEPSSNTGAVVFNAFYHGEDSNGQRRAAAVIDCAGQGISNVEAIVYDERQAPIAVGGPWDCDFGQGNIAAVPAGNDRTIIVAGKDQDGYIVIQGRTTVDIEANSVNHVGTVDCFSFTPSLQTPTDGSKFDLTGINLDWSDVAGATAYQVVISENKEITEPILEVTVTDSIYGGFQIPKETTYYWQVFAMGANNNKSVGSYIWSFSSSSMSAPELTSPSDRAMIDTSEVALDWNDVNGATAYRVIVSENHDMTEPILDETTTASNYATFQISKATTYHWQVFAMDEDNNKSVGSQIWSFSASAMRAPELTSPGDEAIVDTDTVTLDWLDVNGAAEYQVIVSKNKAMTEPVIDVSVTDSNYATFQVSKSTTYHWQVFAIDAHQNKSIGSEIWSFSASKISAPELTSPSDGSIVDTSEVTLDWHDVDGAAAYQVIVSKNRSMTEPVIDVSVTDSNYATFQVSKATTYHWQVFAIDPQQNKSDGSQIWSFSTPNIAAPEPASPNAGAVIDTAIAALDWHDVSGATRYRVIVSENNDMTEPVLDMSVTGSNYGTFHITKVTTFYWQVFAMDEDDNVSDGSTIRSFDSSVIFIPELNAPHHRSAVEAGVVALDWLDTNGAVEYRVVVSGNNDMTDVILNETVTGSRFTPTGLSNANTYYWRVFAIDAHQNLGPGSSIWSFDTKTWKSIAAGLSHTLAIRTGGTLWAWGSNDSGQLGLGNHIREQQTPMQVGTDSDWAYVAAGDRHSMAIKTNGDLWIWGNNFHRQLGLGHDDHRHTPQRNGSGWRSAAGGSGHTVALKTNGQLWAWGRGDDGQLGVGGYGYEVLPARVGSASNWTSVSAGYSHTMAINSSDQLWVWGFNPDGRLGLGDGADEVIPTPNLLNHPGWMSAAAGELHTMALRTNGELWSWGDNSDGQLGINDTTVTQMKSPAWIRPDSDWAAIATSNHTIALKSDGEIWAWGMNQSGQLGIGDDGMQLKRFSPVRVGLDSDWHKVCVGGSHSVAIKTNGELWVWGYNNDGQLGLGDIETRKIPTHLISNGQ